VRWSRYSPFITAAGPILKNTVRVVNCFTDPRLGGPGRRSLDVGERLVERGVDVHFLVPNGDDGLADAATAAGFSVHRTSIPRIRSPRQVGENLRFLTTFRGTARRITRLLDSIDPDIVHVNTPYNFQTARAAARSSGDLVWHFNDTLTPWPINRIAGRLGARWADEIVVSADAVRNHFFRSAVETKTIYPPVDVAAFDPGAYREAPAQLRDELGLDEAAPVIGTIGNLNPAKGHQYLLEAVPSVLEQFPDATFLVVGAQLDSRREYYERLQRTVSRRGISDAVRFTGWRSDIPELLSLFDLFVLPSVTEACPIVVLEAMAMCCPTVATDVGGVREQLPSQEYGWVVPPEDAAALASTVTRVLDSASERREVARNARQRAEKVFSLEACVEAHLSVYESVVER